MIKTTYFDEDYNTVDESDAKFILQSIFDDDGNLIKEIEIGRASCRERV